MAANVGSAGVSFRLGAATPQAVYLGATAAWTSVPPPYTPLDADAAAYITAVEAADGVALENGVRQAIDDFVIGLKADSLWTPIVHATLLMGPRTLAGALVPLKGTAATNNNFVSADYDRHGIVGNGTTKHLDTNVANNSLPQNDFHMSILTNDILGSIGGFMGVAAAAGSSSIARLSTSTRWRCRTTSEYARPSFMRGLSGVSRASGTAYSIARDGGVETPTIASVAPGAGNIHVMRVNGGAYAPSAGNDITQVYWYSIGNALTLSALATRVGTLRTTLGDILL